MLLKSLPVLWDGILKLLNSGYHSVVSNTNYIILKYNHHSLTPNISHTLFQISILQDGITKWIPSTADLLYFFGEQLGLSSLLAPKKG